MYSLTHLRSRWCNAMSSSLKSQPFSFFLLATNMEVDDEPLGITAFHYWQAVVHFHDAGREAQNLPLPTPSCHGPTSSPAPGRSGAGGWNERRDWLWKRQRRCFWRQRNQMNTNEHFIICSSSNRRPWALSTVVSLSWPWQALKHITVCPIPASVLCGRCLLLSKARTR